MRHRERVRRDEVEQFDIEVQPADDPFARRMLAPLVHVDDDHRRDRQQDEHLDERRQQLVVEPRVHGDGDRQPRKEGANRARAVPHRQPLRHDREHARGGAVEDGRAEPADDPEHERRVATRGEVEDVLDQPESGADRKPLDRGIHRKTEAPRGHERHDEDRFQ